MTNWNRSTESEHTKKSIEKLIECKTLDWIRSIATLNCTANTEIKSILLMFFFRNTLQPPMRFGQQRLFFPRFFLAWVKEFKFSAALFFYWLHSIWVALKTNKIERIENERKCKTTTLAQTQPVPMYTLCVHQYSVLYSTNLRTLHFCFQTNIHTKKQQQQFMRMEGARRKCSTA